MRISKPPQERRAELVAAARELFDKKGIDKTRVSDIVRKVGVAQGVFYYYFSSKDEIVDEIIEQMTDELDCAAKAILNEHAPYCRKVSGFIELYIDLVDKFLGDDEENLMSLVGDNRFGLSPALLNVLLKNLQALVEMGAENGQVTAPYPWEMAQVLLYGMATLARAALPGRELVYTLVEQGLGLPKGELTACAATHSHN